MDNPQDSFDSFFKPQPSREEKLQAIRDQQVHLQAHAANYGVITYQVGLDVRTLSGWIWFNSSGAIVYADNGTPMFEQDRKVINERAIIEVSLEGRPLEIHE